MIPVNRRRCVLKFLLLYYAIYNTRTEVYSQYFKAMLMHFQRHAPGPSHRAVGNVALGRWHSHIGSSFVFDDDSINLKLSFKQNKARPSPRVAGRSDAAQQ